MIYRAIMEHYREHALPPSIRILMTVSGLQSSSAVHHQITKLVKQGRVERIRRQPVPTEIKARMMGHTPNTETTMFENKYPMFVLHNSIPRRVRLEERTARAELTRAEHNPNGAYLGSDSQGWPFLVRCNDRLLIVAQDAIISQLYTLVALANQHGYVLPAYHFPSSRDGLANMLHLMTNHSMIIIIRASEALQYADLINAAASVPFRPALLEVAA